jgi:putative transposase
MSARKVILSNDEIYHVYNRGNGKHFIFHDNQDKTHFVKLLCILNHVGRKKLERISSQNSFVRSDEPLVAVGAYVLMDNHFHILLQQVSENGVAKFIHKICTAYASYYNKKYNHTGSLYEGRFKAKHVTNDVYLKYLYAYIHLNPAKMIDQNWRASFFSKEKEVMEFIQNYRYSSFHDYYGILRPENAILSPEKFPLYFETPKIFKDMILSWLSLEKILSD